jgi:hypothetical protein
MLAANETQQNDDNFDVYTDVVGVFVEAQFDELFESFAEVASQLRWIVLWYEKERFHRMQV